MISSTNDLHECRLGETSYWFRTPDVYDPAKARRVLTRQRVRRPAPHEFQVAAMAGVAALAEVVGDAAEGQRQRALLEDWYRLIVPTDENEIDEPDLMARGEELLRLEQTRNAAMQAIYPDIAAIEANLERHWPPYAELLADRSFWDDVSRIEIVRLLLSRVGAVAPPRDDEGLMAQSAYQTLLPPEHRVPLATFAFRLLAPSESQRKN